MKIIASSIGTITLTLLTSACSVFGVRTEERPLFEVVQKSGDREVRKYSSYVVAKTTVEGDYEEAQNEGFRRLAKFIFGDNTAEDSIAMTAPVTQTSNQDGDKIAMTAPVLQSGSEAGWTVSFMMPAKYSLESIPKPRDQRIILEKVPEQYLAAIIYSWGRGFERNQEKGKELLEWLQTETKYAPVGPLISAGYDPPWTLTFLRLNEMLVVVEPRVP